MQGDFAGTMAGDRRYSTGTIEGLVKYCTNVNVTMYLARVFFFRVVCARRLCLTHVLPVHGTKCKSLCSAIWHTSVVFRDFMLLPFLPVPVHVVHGL